jgi:thiopurine S-methyltransferase
MKADFWLERWREGQTHFHQSRVTPLLQKYWPALELPQGSRVLVPLCGKTLDMLWLAEQGHQVLGVELSPLAVEQFFSENGLQPETRTSSAGRHYSAGNIEIICGDIFALDTSSLAACVAAYDRAALVALPASLRPRYVDHVYGQLSSQYRGLLLTLEYPQEQMDGPPFSLGEAHVRSLYGAHSRVETLDRRGILDKEPKFAARGLTRLDTAVYRLSASRP